MALSVVTIIVGWVGGWFYFSLLVPVDRLLHGNDLTELPSGIFKNLAAVDLL